MILVSSRPYYPAPFPESCGKVVCKITIGQPPSHQALRNIWLSKSYVLAGYALFYKTSDFVSILDLKSKRFLCHPWMATLGTMMFSRKECLFQHRRMENHVDVFYSSRNGLLLLLEGAEIPVKGYDLLKRHMVYRRKRSQQENPDAESIMEDQDLAMQQDQEHAGAISKETITSCDDPFPALTVQ
uniref:Uncharacterized protein n=1 Tax=Hucho hucho TaxID=62062 RepID=A0A4W5JQ12_9TELE